MAYFVASFGGVAMHVSSVSTERGRDVNVNSPTSGDVHALTDRGKRANTTTLELLFVDRPNLPPYLDRYDAFVKLVEESPLQILSHPLDPAYMARAAQLAIAADSGRLEVRATCTFHREDRVPMVLPAEAGTESYVGRESVVAQADIANAAIAAQGISSTVPAAAAATVTAWDEAEEIDSNQVLLEVSSLTQQIDAAVLELDLETNLDRWEVYRAMVELRYSIVRAGEALTAAAAKVFEVFIDQPQPLRVIVAEVLGTKSIEEDVADVTQMNRLRTPGRVPAGTSLLMRRRAA